jgi:ATP-dependent Clp protease ATP-binding subunit ClpB
LEEIRHHFRPEFINRLDDIIVFHRLGVNQIKAIVDIQLRSLMARLAQRQIVLALTDAAKSQLASVGFDPVYGARPLKRAIQRDVMNALAQSLLKGDIRDGSHVTGDYEDGKYVFSAN